MKTRSGFVSNSSTSSFILSSGTTGEVAYEMLSIVAKDYYLMGLIPEDKVLFEKMAKALLFLNVSRSEIDIPICIPWTINYRTYIAKKNDHIEVLTSDNHSWRSIEDIFIWSSKSDDFDNDTEKDDILNLQYINLEKWEDLEELK